MNHYFTKIDGWTDQAMQALYSAAVASAEDGDTIVEVGCWKGKSFCFLLVEAANSGKKLKIVGIDHFKGSVGEEALIHEASCIDIHKICKENAEKAGYPFVLQKRSSPDAAEDFPDGSLRFVLLDASHDSKSVAADITAWLPKVKPGGMLAGHDFGYPSVAGPVKELVPGFEVAGSCWKFRVPEKAPVKQLLQEEPEKKPFLKPAFEEAKPKMVEILKEHAAPKAKARGK